MTIDHRWLEASFCCERSSCANGFRQSPVRNGPICSDFSAARATVFAASFIHRRWYAVPKPARISQPRFAIEYERLEVRSNRFDELEPLCETGVEIADDFLFDVYHRSGIFR